MRLALGIIAASVGLVIPAGGCGGDDESSNGTASGYAKNVSTSTAKDEPSGTGASRGRKVKVIKTRYGRILVDGRSRALYLFTRERSKRSRCYGDCATAWPPFLASGGARAGKGAKADLLGTTKRRDGKTQVTYNGHPLYYYVSDNEPGEVLCQDVEEFGGIWYVVSSRGRAIT
jgi:predicted lipoprotein with Yx(FWY)xxD motif